MTRTEIKNIFFSGKVKSQIIQTELREKIQDEGKIEDILSAIPLRVENTLNYHRVSLVGKTKKKNKRRMFKHSYFLE